MRMEELANPVLEEIADRHWRSMSTEFTVEGHRHGLRGCRCLSCDVTTGYMIGTGVSCDETPEVSEACDGGCLCPVLTEAQANDLVQAVADREWLIREARRLEGLVASYQQAERRLAREASGPWPFQVVRRRKKEQE